MVLKKLRKMFLNSKILEAVLKIHLYRAYKIFVILQNHISIALVVNMTYLKYRDANVATFLIS